MESCQRRIDGHLESRMEDLGHLLELYQKDTDAYDDDLGNLFEYGLSLDYVSSDTYSDQEHGYVRYQLSYGGPSDEIRYYVDYEKEPYRIEYHFLDWWDHAKRILSGKYLAIAEELWCALGMDFVLR